MSYYNRNFSLPTALSGEPDAEARIEGGRYYPRIRGYLRLYQTRRGVVVYVTVDGLPFDKRECGERIFGFHIHNGGECEGDENDPFSKTGPQFDRFSCEHPYHSGDMPPLFGNNGFAVAAFLTNRFSVRDVIGKTVVIHDMPDDFTTQPSGSSGKKIACGVIEPYDAEITGR